MGRRGGTGFGKEDPKFQFGPVNLENCVSTKKQWEGAGVTGVWTQERGQCRKSVRLDHTPEDLFYKF
jgi:hypothetical protein